MRGTFEAHLTVDTERSAEFEALCGELGVDHVGIELAEGVHRAQPMTASHHRGELADVMVEVEALRAKLVAAGFTVVRTKLEASPRSPTRSRRSARACSPFSRCSRRGERGAAVIAGSRRPRNCAWQSAAARHVVC